MRNTVLLFCLMLFVASSALAGAHEDSAIAAEHAHDVPVATGAALTEPSSRVTSETVQYGEIDGKPVYGYLARPAGATGALPGLIVIHEWWGLNDNIRKTTDRLAGEGFAALAVDLYGGESASVPKEAMRLMSALNQGGEVAEENLRLAHRYLTDSQSAPRTASIGWCLGGRWSLRTALLLPDELDAAVIYYGSVVTDESQLATLQMPILGNFASDDPIIPVDTVNTFTSTLQSLGKDVDVKIYPNTKHAFSNPSGLAYEPEAAEDAWNRSVTFLRAHLAQ